MQSASQSTIAALFYATPPQINFARLVSDLDTALEACPHDRRHLTWDCDDVAIFDLDGARIVLGWQDRLSGPQRACLSVAIGPGPDGFGPDRFETRRRSVAQAMVDRITARYPTEALVWHSAPGIMTAEALDEATELLLGEMAVRAAADAALAAEMAQAVAAAAAMSVAPEPKVAHHALDLGRDLDRYMDRGIGLEDDDDLEDPVVRADFEAADDIWTHAARAGTEDDEEWAVEDIPRAIVNANEKVARRNGKTATVDPLSIERLIARMEEELASDNRLEEATPFWRPTPKARPAKGAAPTRPEPGARARARARVATAAAVEIANDIPDLPRPHAVEMQRVRAALYPVEEVADKNSTAMRLAVGSMSTTLILVAAPVGAALLTYNALAGANVKVTSRVMALTGAFIALSQLPGFQALAALI